MRIGELAERAGVTTKAVRYYESLGMLAVDRRSNGYREYPESQVDAVREIHALGRLGLAVDQTRPFLDCLASGHPNGDDCSTSLAAYRDAIDALGSQIETLSARRQALVELLESANTRAEPLCEFSAVTA